MLNIPEYKEYAGETKIALMDNSSLAFMHELSQRSYPSDGILSVYDLILIPKWVMEEIEDSTYRSWYCVTCLRRIVSHRGVKSIKAVTTFACKKTFCTFHYTGWVCKWILWRYPQCGIISNIESLQIVFAHVMTLMIML